MLKFTPCNRDFYLPDVSNFNKTMIYLVVHWASWYEYLLALRPDLVVPGKWTVLSVSPVIMSGTFLFWADDMA